VIRTGDGKCVVFWRAKCRVTGRELNYCTHMHELLDFEPMREWVGKFFRNLELLEVRPWDAAEDGHRVQYPVPIQHVKFDVKVPDLAQPERRKKSLFISRPLGGRSLLRGAI
jgi:hypothetical protein